MTQQVGSYTHHISDHVHFFHPRCGAACVCSANALEEFTETALRAVPQGTATSTLVWEHFPRISQLTPPRKRRVLCSTWCPS